VLGENGKSTGERADGLRSGGGGLRPEGASAGGFKMPEAAKDGDPEDVPSLRTLRSGPRAVVARGAGKSRSEIRILFRRDNGGQ